MTTKATIRARDLSDGEWIVGLEMFSGLEPQFVHVSADDFEKVNDYMQDDVGNVALLMNGGSRIVIVQSIDCEWVTS